MSNPDLIQIELCPQLRYLRTLVDGILLDWHAARSSERQSELTGQAIDLARLIANVIEPLARQSQSPAMVREYHHLQQRLTDLARPWVRHVPEDFPEPKDKTLLILDRLEQLEERLKALQAVREQKRRAA